MPTVLWIRDILVRYGSGSGDTSLWLIDPDQDPAIFFMTFKTPTKIIFFVLALFEGTLTTFFKGKRSKRSHKTLGIKVFLTIFSCWQMDLDADPLHCLQISNIYLLKSQKEVTKQNSRNQDNIFAWWQKDPDPQHCLRISYIYLNYWLCEDGRLLLVAPGNVAKQGHDVGGGNVQLNQFPDGLSHAGMSFNMKNETQSDLFSNKKTCTIFVHLYKTMRQFVFKYIHIWYFL